MLSWKAHDRLKLFKGIKAFGLCRGGYFWECFWKCLRFSFGYMKLLEYEIRNWNFFKKNCQTCSPEFCENIGDALVRKGLPAKLKTVTNLVNSQFESSKSILFALGNFKL